MDGTLVTAVEMSPNTEFLKSFVSRTVLSERKETGDARDYYYNKCRCDCGLLRLTQFRSDDDGDAKCAEHSKFTPFSCFLQTMDGTGSACLYSQAERPNSFSLFVRCENVAPFMGDNGPRSGLCQRGARVPIDCIPGLGPASSVAPKAVLTVQET